jgi:hypothetical protein
VTQPRVWIGTIEISCNNEQSPDVFQPVFTRVTTWASNPKEFREKCVRMSTECGWNLLGVVRASPVPDDREFTEEIEAMLERTRGNPNAIVYGPFHSYPLM